MEIASLSKALLLILLEVLVIWLAPVAVEVSRSGPPVAGLTTTPLVIGLAAGRIRRSRELEATCTTTAAKGTTVAANGHRLTSAMSTSSNIASSLETETLGRLGCTWR